MAEAKPRDVQVMPIAAETTILRSRSWTRLKFEIEYGLQRGTTANTYLLRADRVALIDPPGETFTALFLRSLQDRIDPTTIDYIIMGRVNPNRCVTLKALLAIAPQAVVIASNPGSIVLKEALPELTPTVQIVRGDETLDLGRGHRLSLIPTSTPRWPTSICTYDAATQILFSDKFFGAHICSDQVLDEGFQTIQEDRQYYFDSLMAPNARQVESILDKLAEYPARLYATGHGPLVKYGLEDLTKAYRTWSQAQKAQELAVALLYASAYGNTATLAQAIARGITKSGVRVESINCEVSAPEEVQAAIEKADGFIIGSPTLGGHAPTQVMTALGIAISSATKLKLAGVFGSYGWSGEAIDLLESKLKDAGFQLGFETIRVKFKPTAATLQHCEEAGTDFAQSLKKAKKTRQSRQKVSLESQVDPTVQAVGRIVGSLCVVTARQDEVSSAMLADWVAQATFNPPGLTVAVAKDRAIESLLYRGNAFVLNILGEGKHLGLMKHFLKPFSPGEDRFVGVETQPAQNGCPTLKDAVAYLECTVDNRMDCGDHWLVYALIEAGAVIDPDRLTAIHHRKSGNHY
ncbi:diflavin flavoprotein [Altericista sp. CCNU0014]|uniref:diflavin flavoprotein n=1 Tax=Altericista sp. CCNU0014 TaxID=3082949 RepID=UPI00384CCBE0